MVVCYAVVVWCGVWVLVGVFVVSMEWDLVVVFGCGGLLRMVVLVGFNSVVVTFLMICTFCLILLLFWCFAVVGISCCMFVCFLLMLGCLCVVVFVYCVYV